MWVEGLDRRPRVAQIGRRQPVGQPEPGQCFSTSERGTAAPAPGSGYRPDLCLPAPLSGKAGRGLVAFPKDFASQGLRGFSSKGGGRSCLRLCT